MSVRVEGLEILYDPAQSQVTGLEILYDPAQSQVTGLELIFSSETYRDSDHIFDPSCTLVIQDQDHTVTELLLGSDTATVGVSGADQGSGDDTLALNVLATDSLAATEQAFLSYADHVSTDVGVGVDFAFLLYADQIATDSGSGLETVLVGVLAEDNALGTDSAQFGILEEETATTSEQAEIGIIAEDTASGVDVAQVLQTDWLLGDTATADDEGIVGVITTDSASGTEDSILPKLFSVSEHVFCVDLACADVSGDFFIGKMPRLGPEIYWPTWTRCHTNVSLSGETNRTFNFYQFVAEEAVLFNALVSESYRRKWLSTISVRENRLAWVTSFAPSDNQEFTIRYQVQTPMGPVTGTVRQAISLFDYETAVDPVWWVDGVSRRLVLRNLHIRQSRRTSFDGVYSLCMELHGVTPDSGVYWRSHPDQTWEWIDAESPTLSGDQFTLPITGTLFFAWGSEMLLRSLETGTVTIEWYGGRTIQIPVTRKDVPNRFDVYGKIVGLPRLRREDNLAYKRRLLTYAVQPSDSTIPGVVRTIGAKIGMIGQTNWDGVSTLVLDASGASGVSQITVVGVDRIREVEESLSIAGGDLYYARYPNWKDGWLVLVDGVPEPGVSVSGNVVRLSRPVSGSVTALYAIEQYQLEPGVSGTIRSILPGTGLTSGSYRVIYIRNVRAYNLGSLTYQQERLQDAQGLPNRDFHELANQLAESNPTALGRARWGAGARWLSILDDKPQPARLPLPMDLNLNDN